MFTASGLLVRFLKVFEKQNYQSVKWVRYLTKAQGSYQVRVSFHLSEYSDTKCLLTNSASILEVLNTPHSMIQSSPRLASFFLLPSLILFLFPLSSSLSFARLRSLFTTHTPPPPAPPPSPLSLPSSRETLLA